MVSLYYECYLNFKLVWGQILRARKGWVVSNGFNEEFRRARNIVNVSNFRTSKSILASTGFHGDSLTLVEVMRRSIKVCRSSC